MDAEKKIDWIFRCLRCGAEKVLPAGYEPRTPCHRELNTLFCGGTEFRRVGAQTAEPDTIQDCLVDGDLSLNDARLIG